MRTQRNTVPPRSRPKSETRTQSFTCSTELLRAFDRRTFELGCTFDWLLEEAMQRLLAEASEEDRPPSPPESVHQMKPRAALPLPLPPDATKSTVPPPPTRAQLPAPSLLPPPPPARMAIMFEEPLILDYGRDWLVVDRDPYVIGRSSALADLVIDDAAVSRRHAVIEHTEDGWVITDLGSTNGIIVDGVVVRHAVLSAGVVMTIGPMTFGVRSP